MCRCRAWVLLQPGTQSEKVWEQSGPHRAPQTGGFSNTRLSPQFWKLGARGRGAAWMPEAGSPGSGCSVAARGRESGIMVPCG